MAKSENLFSVTFRGFSREEVIAYMEEMNRSVKAQRDEYEARIAALNDELTTFAEAKAHCESAEKQLDEKNTELAAAEEENERLRTDIENMRLAVAASEEHAQAAEKALEELKAELAAEKIKSAAMESNAKEYDAMLADVNGILATARRKAEELIEEAGARAEQIVAEAERTAKSKADSAVTASEERVNENLKKVKYLYRRQDELAELFKEHKSKVDAFFASLPLASDSDKGESK